MIGDLIKVTRSHSTDVTDIPASVYTVPNQNDQYIQDDKGYVTPRFVGGVKQGSLGKIQGRPAKTKKSLLKGHKESGTYGDEDVLLYPVFFEAYKQLAWIAGHDIVIEAFPQPDIDL
jgi:pyruvate carboxylase